jgi:hypothetical protein
MGAVTYPNADVRRDVEEHFIPVQLNVQDDPGVIDEFNSAWTPTVLVQDAEGREFRRSFGYLDADRLRGELALGRLHQAIHRRDIDRARERAGEALDRTKGDAVREPEARYFAAVATYEATKDVNQLKEDWNRLLDDFPENDWAKKAEFIRKAL